jgi:hypothetical protein
MKKLIILIALFTIPHYLKAQDFPFGKSKEEIRAIFEKSNFPALSTSKSDTRDVFNLNSGLQENCYYKNNACYMMKQIFSSSSAETMKRDIESMQSVMSETYKKEEENVWTDQNRTTRMKLIVIKDKNQFVVEYTHI